MRDNMLATDEIRDFLRRRFDEEVNGVPFEKVTPGSERIYLWKCPEHKTTWRLAPHQQYKNPRRGCNHCLYEGKSLADRHPELLEQWIPERNAITLWEIPPSSTKSIWWRCPEGHEWERSPLQRIGDRRVRGCPICHPKSITDIRPERSLAGTHPHVAKLWHTEKNLPLLPTQVLAGAARKAWFKGGCGHEWENRIGHQVKATACPYCFGKRLLAGFNDLETLRPELCSEWHPSKNETRVPSGYMTGSDESVWWICQRGHEWRTKISHRAAGRGCPRCVAKSFSSVGEEELHQYVRSLLRDTEIIRNDRTLIGANTEVDIYIPELKLTLEYNGIYWHSDNGGKPKTYHYDKYCALQEKGIQLLQVWEDDWKYKKELTQMTLRAYIAPKPIEYEVRIEEILPRIFKNHPGILPHEEDPVTTTRYYGIYEGDANLLGIMSLLVKDPATVLLGMPLSLGNPFIVRDVFFTMLKRDLPQVQTVEFLASNDWSQVSLFSDMEYAIIGTGEPRSYLIFRDKRQTNPYVHDEENVNRIYDSGNTLLSLHL